VSDPRVWKIFLKFFFLRRKIKYSFRKTLSVCFRSIHWKYGESERVFRYARILERSVDQMQCQYENRKHSNSGRYYRNNNNNNNEKAKTRINITPTNIYISITVSKTDIRLDGFEFHSLRFGSHCLSVSILYYVSIYVILNNDLHVTVSYEVSTVRTSRIVNIMIVSLLHTSMCYF